MRRHLFICAVFVILALQIGPLTDARADVVGHLSQVEGRVDVLKGGKLPATPVKLKDGVQPGDVLRTKSLSKAQITFVDNSTMALAPESRVVIESYMYDGAKNKRNVVIELFKGIAHMVVSKVYESAEPDFVVKTQTAIMGIRGTDFGIRCQPNSTDVLNFEGLLQVGNVYPEVGMLPQKAFKVAFSFGSTPGSHWVFLKQMQGTSVRAGLPPTLAWTISDEDKRHFIEQMGIGLNICRRNPETAEEETGGGPPSETITGCAPTTGLSGSDINLNKQDLLVAGFYGSWFTPPYTPPRDPQPTGIELTATTEGGSTPEPPPCDHHKPPHHKPKCDWFHHRHKCDFNFFWKHFCRRDHDKRFNWGWDYFCRRDYDRHFDFGCDRDSYNSRDWDRRFNFDFARNFCKIKDRDNRFDRNRDRDCDRGSYDFRDRDGRFNFEFAKNFCKTKDRDDRFDRNRDRDCDRDSFNFRDRDGRFNFEFAKNFCKTKDRDERFDRDRDRDCDRDSYNSRDRDRRGDYEFAKNYDKPKDRNDRFDRNRDSYSHESNGGFQLAAAVVQNNCKPKGHDDKFDRDRDRDRDRDCDRDSFNFRDRDGRFNFEFAKNFCKTKDRDERFDRDRDRDCDRDSYNSRDRDRRNDFTFAKNYCKPNGYEGRFGNEGNSNSYGDRNRNYAFNYTKNYCKPLGHDNKFDFDRNRNSFNSPDRNRNFNSNLAKNYCKPKGHESQFQSFQVATRRIQCNLTDFHRTGPLARNFQHGGPGPNVTQFIKHSVITNPRVLISQHCPGNGPGALNHRGGPPVGLNQVVAHVKTKCPPKSNIRPGGPVNVAFQHGPDNHNGPSGPHGPQPGGRN